MEWRGEGEAYRITQPSSTSPFLIEDSTYLEGERESSLINYKIGGGVIFQTIITLLVIEIMVITTTLKYITGTVMIWSRFISVGNMMIIARDEKGINRILH